MNRPCSPARTDSEPESLQTLFASLQQRDPSALNTFVDRYDPFVQRTVRRRTSRLLRRYIELDDVVQEVWLTLWPRLNGFCFESEAALRAWMRKVIEHRIRGLVDSLHAQVRDVRRRLTLDGQHAPSAHSIPDPAQCDPADSAIQVERAAQLRANLDALPLHHQQLLHLRYWDGESWELIRRRVGRPSLGAASEMHRRALSRLRHLTPEAVA